jgi:RNA polymerase sigma factor (sigma-70 family)
VDRVRELRTNAYEQFGVYRARQFLLDRGITLPTDQIVSIGHFLNSGLAQADEAWFERNRTGEFTSRLTELFGMTLADFDPSHNLRPLKTLLASAEPYIDWDVFRDFAELLHLSEPEAYERAGRRLRNLFPVEPAEIDLLCDDFVRKALLSAVRAFDLVRGRGSEGAWLETVFYRFALKVLLADRTATKQLEELQRQLPEEPLEELLDSQAEARLLAALPRVLQCLPAGERRAIELYFGVAGGREHTVADVAAALDCSSYHAKAAIVMGLARLAGQLGVQGQLEDEEFRFIRFFLVEGYDLESAAHQLGWSATQARRILREVRTKFARVLRARTISSGATRRTDS